jgi:nucleoside phosphorylase
VCVADHRSDVISATDSAKRADVLFVTAIAEEYAAVLAVDTEAKQGSEWEKHIAPTGLEVRVREFNATSGVLRIAVTQVLGMGGIHAVIASAELLKEYEVACLAMCGVCAGRRGKVELGDVIVADRVWQYSARTSR